MITRTRAGALCGALVALTVAACGSVHAGQITAASGPSPRDRATADAAANLTSFTAPPGARRIAQIPSAATWLKQAPLTTAQIDDVSYWQVTGSPVTELTWVRQHLPHSYTLAVSGTEGGLYMTPYSVKIRPGGSSGAVSALGPHVWYDEFTLKPVAGVLPVRALIVSVASAGKNTTVIRVDAQSSWSMAKSPAERVPGSVTSVTITPVRVGGPIIAGSPTVVTMSSAAEVRKIATLINDLPMYAANVSRACPAPVLEGVRLVFRDGTSGPALATATADTYQCGTVSLTIGSHALIVLGNAAQFVRELDSVAHLSAGFSTGSSGTVNPGGPMKSVP